MTTLRNFVFQYNKPANVIELSTWYTHNFQGLRNQGNLYTIEGSCSARLEGKTGQYRELKREAVRPVRRDKQACQKVRGVCDTVESHLWSTDSRLAFRGIRTLRSSRPPRRYSTVKAADGTTLTGESWILARWAGYFEQL